MSSVAYLLLATLDITQMKEVTKLVVTELTSSKVDETAFAILKRQLSREISIVSLPRMFIFDNLVLSILTELTYKMLQTTRKVLPNCQTSPTDLELLPQVRISFGLHSIEQNFKSQAMTVVE